MNGELIRKARETKGLSQRALAQLVGTPQPNISRIESGERENVSLPTLRKLAAVLEVSADALLAEPTTTEDAATPAA